MMTSSRRFNSRFTHFSLLACTALLLAGCGAQSSQKQSKPKPPLVDVVTITPQSVNLTSDLPGRTVAYRIAEVRPQVSGIILKRDYKEGSIVKKGQQLYQIDPAPYKAAYDSAKASLQTAKAQLSIAALKVKQYAPLVKTHAVSQIDYANMKATKQKAEAQIASAKAALETARINLKYTKVKSPIKGRSGRSLVTEGALVTGDQASRLTTVQQLNPIYVDATLPATTLLRLKREYAAGQLKKVGDNEAKVKLTLGDGSTYKRPGKLQFSEVTVDPSTDSVTVRAVFPNPDHVLLPGMFAHLKITEGTRDNALLVPQIGITHDPSGKATTMIVGKDGKVEQRNVTAARAVGDKWLVTEGLKAGDRVIVKGLQFVQPGMKVRVQKAETGGSDAKSKANQNTKPGTSDSSKKGSGK